jgi:hypothetical protein
MRPQTLLREAFASMPVHMITLEAEGSTIACGAVASAEQQAAGFQC